MGRQWPAISSTAIQFFGDLHWGRIDQRRLAAIITDLRSGYEGDYLPAARVFVGDETHYNRVQQLTNFVVWADANIPPVSGVLPNGRNWCAIAGNHDRFMMALDRDPSTNTSSSYDYVGGPGDWNAAFGLSDYYAVELPERRLILCSWGADIHSARLSAGQMTFIAAQCAGTSKECTLVIHPPPYDTVGGLGQNGIRHVYTSTQAEFYVDGPGGALSSEIYDLIAGHPNLTCVVSGHTHSPYGAPNLVCTQVLGGTIRLIVNAGALVWDYRGAIGVSPIRTLYIDRADDGFIVSPRDHGRRDWMGFRQGFSSELVEVG